MFHTCWRGVAFHLCLVPEFRYVLVFECDSMLYNSGAGEELLGGNHGGRDMGSRGRTFVSKACHSKHWLESLQLWQCDKDIIFIAFIVLILFPSQLGEYFTVTVCTS